MGEEKAAQGEVDERRVRRRRGNTLARWEVAIVKAMLARKSEFGNEQDILAWFTRPSRSVNHRLIGEIRKDEKHKAVRAATAEELEAFISAWPDHDPETGLSRRGDELLIKAREAMIAAVHTFNGAGLTFRAELFIVTAMIGWTYLLHAWFRREGIDYRYPDSRTRGDEERYWDLKKCLDHPRCPATGGIATNIRFLLEIRHEIEHRMTSRIDELLGAKLQACALNFNHVLRSEFGPGFGLEKRLPIALQFVSFDAAQRSALKSASGLPPHVESVINAFENGLTDDQKRDPAYRITYGFVPVAAKRAGAADLAVQIVDPGSPEAAEVEKIIFKEVSKNRYPAMKVVSKVQASGFPRFTRRDHGLLWKKLDAKRPEKGFGCAGDYKGAWVWFDSWVAVVLKHCEENAERYA